MNKVRRNIIISIFVLILFVSVLLVFYFYNKKAREIRIAAIIPLSGATQHKPMVNALNLAIDDINFKGGINGRKIKLYVADSKTDPETGKKAFLNFEKKIKPLLYISSTSVVSMAIAPLAERNNVVLTGLVVTHQDFTKDKKWVFRYFTSPSEESRPIMEIAKKLNISTLGVLYQDDPFGKIYEEQIVKTFEGNGINSYSYSFPLLNKDFTSEAKKVQPFDAVYIIAYTNSTEEAIRAIRKNNYKGYIFTHSGIATLFRKMTVFNDIYVAAPIIYDPNYQYAADLQKKYEEKYQDNFTQRSAISYDFINLLSGIIENQPLMRENVRNSLESGFSYPGIFGFINKKEGEHDIIYPLYPARIINGKLEYLNE